MTDEYFEIGKTLAELYELTDYDPWQPPVDPERQAAEQKLEALQQRIFDQLQKAGMFDKPSFDPTENDDPAILEDSSLTMFWRLTVTNRRISDVMVIEPAIEKLSVSLRNTTLGCWIAFTGKRIADRIEIALNNHGMITQLAACDINGNAC